MTIRPEHQASVPLADIARQQNLRLDIEDETADISGITLDSRDARQGDLYAALPGARVHGADFAFQAINNGAAAILTDEAGLLIVRENGLQQPVLVSSRPPREILGEVSAQIYGTAEPGAKIFGVTGTNGKTSVVYLLAELLKAAGFTAGLSSTAERRAGETVMPATLTSPEAPELHGLLARMQEQGVDAIALEVSAHATARHRIDGVHFDVVAFNNFSQDHLDDFGDMHAYFEAKLALFAPEHAARGVVVVDTAHGQRLARESQIPVTTVSTEYGVSADWHLAVTRQNIDGVSFVLQGPEGAHFRGRVPVFGRFMAENAALALIMMHEAGIELQAVADGLDGGVIPVYIPGRLEEITSSEDPERVRFYVDYGHTPGAFQAMLDALVEVAPARVIFLFGADGDRDATKREEMGRIAALGSDVVIVCDYNPRNEDPAAIRAQLLDAARGAKRAKVHEVPDPHDAVRFAISLAEPNDVIVYAGPGHEDFQEIAGGARVAYSAREEVRGALREAGMLK